MKRPDEEDDGVLGGLRAEEAPPAAMEDRLVSRLRRDGLLGRERRRPALLPLLAAAALVCLAAGWALGRRTPAPTTVADHRSEYLLLLYEDPGFETAPSEEAARVEEYSQWAGRLAASGSLVGAEKLRNDAITFFAGAEKPGEASSSTPGGLLAGFFLVRAGSDGEARQIARDCPHLRHGGRVVVRPIEPTPRT